jgi:hypothetical protein
MPPLRQREQTLRAELPAIADQTSDTATFLRLAETLAAFLGRIRSTPEPAPIASTPAASGGPPAPGGPARAPTGQSDLLRKGVSTRPTESRSVGKEPPFTIVKNHPKVTQ